MLRYLILLFIIFANATALECPPSAGQALLERNQKALLECDADTLKQYYNDNTCCITNIAECNYIEKAWWMRVNVLKHEPICDYMLRHPEHMKHFKRRMFLKRIKKRRLKID